MEANFFSEEDFNTWCRAMVFRIYYNNISMNDEGIKAIVKEVANRLHISEGHILFGPDRWF